MKHILLTMEHFNPKLIVIGLLFAVPFMSGSGCSTGTDAGLEEGPVPFEILGAVYVPGGQNVFSCRFNFSNIDMGSVNNKEGLSGLELVIDNSEDFSTYLTCSDTVEVDFGVEFILSGISTVQPSFPYVKNQTVRLLNGALYYEVALLEGIAAQPGSASYIVKVLSRDYLEYPVVFEVFWVEEK